MNDRIEKQTQKVCSLDQKLKTLQQSLDYIISENEKVQVGKKNEQMRKLKKKLSKEERQKKREERKQKMREELKQELASQIKEEMLQQMKSQQKTVEMKAQNEKNEMELTKQVSILEDDELQIDREETRITPAK